MGCQTFCNGRCDLMIPKYDLIKVAERWPHKIGRSGNLRGSMYRSGRPTTEMNDDES